jgi:EAL domain-containing protein (putative c-di-GMP-specific phosphodiesterase class I)
MSLLKQLFILIAIIFLVIFTVNFITSVNNTRSYLEIEAEIHAQDTATSLGLSLSPHMTQGGNDPLLLTMVNTIFDRGYYKQIKLVNAVGKELVNSENPSTFESVPTWFINLLPMKTAMAETEISSGWTISGKLFVTISPGYAYLKLYEQAQNALFYSLIAYVFFNVLVYFLLRLILIPLKKIEQLAKDIGNGSFNTIKKLPGTTEIKNVTISMNFMSAKIKQIIEKQTEKLDKAGQQLQLDVLTKLKNKNCFEGDMKNQLISHGEGYVLFIRIDNLGAFSKDKGREVVDSFLVEFAETLKESIEGLKYDISVYRFFGSEFAMLAPSMSRDEVENLGKILSNNLTVLGKKYSRSDLVHIGIVPFVVGSSTVNILSAASEAYEKAHLIGNNAFVIYRNDEIYKLPEESDIVMEEVFAEIMDGDQVVPIGSFISIAEKYNSVTDLDKGIIQKVVQAIGERDIEHPVNINLSMSSVKNPQFLDWLGTNFKGNQEMLKQLVFGIPAYSASKDLKSFEMFTSFVHGIGAKIMLKRYETNLISLEQVKRFDLDYLRLARELTTGISKDVDKQQFVEAMKEIGDLLDTKIIAEAVVEREDFDKLKAIGIYGASN